ncbi:MAG: cysteine desulfurase [Planctomycetaceae bacterium]|jgi:cysteine desulfurase/selenocysteine lyase|nr:cysteine desulfurase [Planctomycetaceae bacterium]
MTISTINDFDAAVEAAVREYAGEFFPEQNVFEEPSVPASPSVSYPVPAEEDDAQQIWREISRTLYPNRETFSDSGFGISPLSGGDTLQNPVSGLLRPPVSGFPREFDVAALRKDFPILSETVNGKPLVWFDNGATTQKPRAVMERLVTFYEHENSNVHRGAHTLAARSTDAYENARETVRKFLGASSTNEIVFVRGTTEAVNLVAGTWGRDHLHAGDEILVSRLEHHANIVPWQILAGETGAVLRAIPVDSNGELLWNDYTALLNNRTKLVAVTQVSNAIGTVTPTAEIVRLAHQYGAKVLIDGAQSVPHLPVDVQLLDADFFVFSGHKIFAPTGIGVLYGKEELLNAMRPYQSGGNMIADVTFEKTVYQRSPNRFEAGTANIAGAVGLGAALDYVNAVGMENIRRYEHGLLEYARESLAAISGIRVIGNPRERAGVVSFTADRFTTDEINKALAAEGIAIRAGHHCAQPVLRHFGLESTVRASFAFYNTFEEVDFLTGVLKNITQTR